MLKKSTAKFFSRALSVMLVSLAQSLVAPALAETSADEVTLKNQAAEYGKAFARGDADALAAMWAEDGTFTDSTGQVYKGREAISRYFRSQFAEGAKANLDIVIDALRIPADGVAVEEGNTRVMDGPYTGARGRYLVVHTKKNGAWLMQTAVETPFPQEAAKHNLDDFAWLVGNWSCPGQKDVLHMRAEWSKGKTFMICRFYSGASTPQASGAALTPIAEAMEIIGFDPVSGHLRTWHFDESGGFGNGRLEPIATGAQAGKSWREFAHGVQADGTGDGGINTYTKVDDNTFTWQSTRRQAGGRAMPDARLLTLTRDQGRQGE